MAVTTLEYHDGRCITHVGTSGFTVTGMRTDDNVDVKLEFDIVSEEEMIAMMGVLLATLDEVHGENFVTQCFGYYAQKTGKTVLKQGNGRDLVVIRGHKKKR